MLNQWFGELRHLLFGGDASCTWGIEESRALQSLLLKAYHLDRKRYIEQWLPYLDSFTNLPVLRAEDIGVARLLYQALPESQTFVVSLDGLTWTHEQWSQLCMEPWITRAKTLSFCRSNLHSWHLEHMMQRSLSRLELFFAYGNAFDDQSIQLLVQHDLPQLKVLDLSSNPIGPKGFELLASSTMPALQKLMMGHLQLHDECVRVLAQSPVMSGLEALRLNNCQLTDRALFYLAQSPLSSSLTYLNLDNNDIGPRGFQYLIDSPYLTRLIYLFLRDCGLDEAHEHCLKSNSSFDQLQHLFIS